jgi:glycerol-3-phosphate dehydrogenase (NAD(P)+)
VKRLAVIGGGSWGTALAIALGRRFERVRLWAYEREVVQSISDTRVNTVFLPGFTVPEQVEATGDLGFALEDADIVLGVMPSHHARAVYGRMLPYLLPSMRIVSATKGIENGTFMRMSEVVADVVAPKFRPHVAVLSGPTFAREIAAGEPATAAISSSDGELACELQQAFATRSFRLYTNGDPIGVELGAALKNVIAIAAGVCHGLELGSNTVAALITRGLAEISRLAVAHGGEPRTLAGLAGLGDLVLTCTGDLSRNRAVGIELGRGRSLAEITGSMKMVAEGISTTYAAVGLARREGVEMPISEQMYLVLREGKAPREAVRDLMERSLKPE